MVLSHKPLTLYVSRVERQDGVVLALAGSNAGRAWRLAIEDPIAVATIGRYKFYLGHLSRETCILEKPRTGRLTALSQQDVHRLEELTSGVDRSAA